MKDLKATKREDGFYDLKGRETYKLRNLLEELGGVWQSEQKAWKVTREVARKVDADMLVQVKVESYCHEKERVLFVTEEDLKSGFVMVGCSVCKIPDEFGEYVAIIESL